MVQKTQMNFLANPTLCSSLSSNMFFFSSRRQQARLFDTMVLSFIICCKPMGQVPSTVSSLTQPVSLQWGHCEGSIWSPQQVSAEVLQLHLYFCKKKQDQRSDVVGLRSLSQAKENWSCKPDLNPYLLLSTCSLPLSPQAHGPHCGLLHYSHFQASKCDVFTALL